MSQENVEVIRSLTERINAGDEEGVLELIHPDLELFPPEDEPEAKEVYRGREGYREYSSYWTDTFDQWHTEVEEYIDRREYVVVVGRTYARGRASGARVEGSATWVWRVRDRMGIECREYRTKEEALEAAGLRSRTRLLRVFSRLASGHRRTAPRKTPRSKQRGTGLG
jgi:ketosteroid isomerase-like protein